MGEALKIGILGGGITGITLQRFLNHESEILEASDKVGGLCQTIMTPLGNKYDIGGHIFLSKYNHVNKLIDEVLGDNCELKRSDKKLIYHKGDLFHYPFYKDLSLLEKQDIYECVTDFLNRKTDNPFPVNLKEWFNYHYGKGIAERNLIPYTNKLWNIPCEEMSMEWSDSRIPKLTQDQLLKSALGLTPESEPTYFRYPKQGGFEAVCKALQKSDAAITCNFKITDIYWDGSQYLVTSDQGRRKLFDKIVITFPIHEAIGCFANASNESLMAVSDLVYNSINIVFMCMRNEYKKVCNVEAIYLPDPDIITHRVCFPGFFSEDMRNRMTTTFAFEVTTNQGDGVHELSDKHLVDRVIDDISKVAHSLRKNSGIFSSFTYGNEYILESHVSRFKYGYPVYTLDYEKNIRIAKKFFERIGVPLCGRFAEFEYINSDECIKRAIDLADKLNKEYAES